MTEARFAERLDAHCVVGLVFRGFDSEIAARAYAQSVRAFWDSHNHARPVFVVRGPTSITRKRFEVVDASCGYSIVACIT